MNNNEEEKVYVAIGNDLQDGYKTLAWTLEKWKSQPISIVILHVTYNISNEFVYTPFGKLPASSVSEEKVEVLRRYEQEKIDKLFSKYISYCRKVKAEILKVGKSDEPVQKLILDLISQHQITNLVLGYTFMKSSFGKSKNAISGSFYIHQNKPEFCKVFIIWGGKQVFLGEQNHEKTMEDDQGVIVAKIRDKSSIKDWLGKMFKENPASSSSSERNYSPQASTSSGSMEDSTSSQNQWEKHIPELENYYERLSSWNLEKEDEEEEEETDKENDAFENMSPTASNILELLDYNMSTEEKIEQLRARIDEAREIIRSNKNKAKIDSERQAKAEWAISICNARVEELEAKMKDEAMKREELQKELNAVKEYVCEIIGDVEQSKSRLHSLVELQSELSSKLQISTSAKSQAVAQLEKAVTMRTEMVREIEELRRQRAVFHRRIEFCKEKDAIGMAERLSEGGVSLKEYTAEEMRLATEDFSEAMKLSFQDDELVVYKGQFKHISVTVKMFNDSRICPSQEDFQAKVELLSQIRHPHLLAMIGFCSELRCIVFEYMHNGSLRNKLQTIGWQDRIRIAAEVGSGLGFLHLAQPGPIIHGHLSASTIFLDRNLIAKISGFELNEASNDISDMESDIRAFGLLLIQLLTGRNYYTEVGPMSKVDLVENLDDTARQWPRDLAERLAELGLRCVGSCSGLRIRTVMEELDKSRRKACDLMGPAYENVNRQDEDLINIPRVFICPIYQEVMKNPHVAADGFSYEFEAIEEWIKTGHDVSPMTNLQLQHKFLTPNQTLRTLIQDWHNKMSIAFP